MFKMSKNSLEKFAKTVLTMGVNLQKEQVLIISTPISAQDAALALAEEAYSMGAKRVVLEYSDSKMMKLRYLNETTDTLKDLYDFEINRRLELMDKNVCRVAIYSEDPEAYSGCDPEKLDAHLSVLRARTKAFMDAQMTNAIRWCVTAVPEPAWAKKIFPDLDNDTAQEKLWEMIQKTMLIDNDDPIQAWKEKAELVERRATFLNDHRFKTMHYKNSIGTDFHVNLMPDSLWTGAAEPAQDGVTFIANLPTEEIFTAPHRLGANGVLVSAKPLCYNGQIINNFRMEFKDGRCIKYSAEVGEDVLKKIIETDEGSHYLGEIALVQYDSPISNLNTLFFNTLFDENASCHFAFGQGYTTTVKDGNSYTTDEIFERGLNMSAQHEDFMVGTSDLSIIGETEDGEMIDIFVNGNFVI